MAESSNWALRAHRLCSIPASEEQVKQKPTSLLNWIRRLVRRWITSIIVGCVRWIVISSKFLRCLVEVTENSHFSRKDQELLYERRS